MASPLSPRETQVLGLAWQCFESEPKINWEKFAELTGYAKSSADTSLRRIKNKLKLHAKGFEKEDKQVHRQVDCRLAVDGGGEPAVEEAQADRDHTPAAS